MLLNDEQLNKLKENELEIMIEIDRLCRKHNIKYSLAFGTLIGAIRHKGFIPWDDDLDIIMTRDEFEKFKKVLPELDEKYFYVDAKISKPYGLLFGKIMKKNTLMAEISTPRSVPSGFFVDIFVAEKTSLNQDEQLAQFNKFWTLRRMLLRRQLYNFKNGAFSRFLYKVSGIILKIIPKKTFIKKDEKNCLKFADLEDYKWITFEITDKVFEQAVYDKDTFENYTDVDFEGHKFMAVKDYDKLLTIQYGDYMALPPEKDRVPHHFVEAIDFGEEKAS